jgi:hypothetical protein
MNVLLIVNFFEFLHEGVAPFGESYNGGDFGGGANGCLAFAIFVASVDHILNNNDYRSHLPAC